MTITIADGRGALWQWDTGRRVKITDGDGVKQVHYQNKCFGRSVDVDVGTDGTAIIPDELLQDWHPLMAYAYVTDDAGGYTKVQVDFAVHKRAKPADYVYTPAEHAGFDRLRAEIGDMSALQTDAKIHLSRPSMKLPQVAAAKAWTFAWRTATFSTAQMAAARGQTSSPWQTSRAARATPAQRAIPAIKATQERRARRATRAQPARKARKAIRAKKAIPAQQARLVRKALLVFRVRTAQRAYPALRARTATARW